MVLDGIKQRAESRGRDKAIEWYVEIKKLEAELAAARARLLALQSSSAVATQMRRLPAIGGPVEPVRDQLVRMRKDAEENLDHVAKDLDRARRRWEKAKKAKGTYDQVRGKDSAVSEAVTTTDGLTAAATDSLDRIAQAAGEAATDAVNDAGDATSSAAGLLDAVVESPGEHGGRNAKQ